jgi:hypothetical protein
MNFSEALPDFTASYADRYISPDLFRSGYDDSLYYADTASTCGENILVNVNNKKLTDRNTCTAATAAYPGFLDVKKIEDPTSASKGLDEAFSASNRKKVSWGPVVVYDEKNRARGGERREKDLFDDNILLFIFFAFVMYLVYSLISLKMEVGYLQKTLHLMYRPRPEEI